MPGDESGSFYDERHINYAKARAYIEVTIDSLNDSVTRWRLVSVISLVILGISIFANVYIITHKEFVPILIKYNEETGSTEVTNVDTQEIKKESVLEALNKHFITKFINCSETYDKSDQSRLYSCTRILSSSNVFSQYSARFESSGKDNWFERYGNSKVLVNVISINKIPLTKNQIKNGDSPTWLIKFTKEIKVKSDKKGKVIPYSAVVITEFEKLARNEKEIRDNPLNFKVISFRVDRETSQN